MNGLQWYVLQSKPHKEHQVSAFLTAQGVETYCPTLHVKPANPRSAKIRPYFPGYLFVHVDLAIAEVGLLKWAPGVVRLVEFGGYPAAVPDYLIYKLRTHLATLNATIDVTCPPQIDLPHGTPVRIIHGPLAGYSAIFDTCLSGARRVRVLLDLLGRQVVTTLDTNAIEWQSHG